MSRSGHQGSWSRRKSFFSGLTPFTSTSGKDEEGGRAKGAHGTTLKKKSTRHHRVSSSSSILTDVSQPESTASQDYDGSTPSAASLVSPTAARPDSLAKTRQSASRFDSLRSLRSSIDNLATPIDDEPLSATSTTAPSLYFPESPMDMPTQTKPVLQHGEVQTSAGMFRKKKEYLVLTDTHLLRYKSQAKAAEAFKSIPALGASRSNAAPKHGNMPSVGSSGSMNEIQTQSDSSGDKHGRLPLRLVVAVHETDDSKSFFPIEVCYMDEEANHASSMTLQFASAEERNGWLSSIRTGLHELRQRLPLTISNTNIEKVARIVERDYDYDPSNCSIFKVVLKQQTAKSVTRTSAEDLTKVASSVCFLAIGVHKVHIIQLGKTAVRSPTTVLAQNNSHSSHGILTLIGLRVSGTDDSIELMFRTPLQKAKVIYLASAAASEIAVRLHYAENFLRPECGHRLFRFSAPAEVESMLAPAVLSNEENCCLDRTLAAYCVAYGADPTRIRYTINYTCEDAPRFELLPSSEPRRADYAALELLAILRALRYNESFGSISLAGISLDTLHGLHDSYGTEYVCSHTKRGTPIRLSTQELSRSSLLVQEIRALAATSKKLRRMDFSGCITGKPPFSSGHEEDSRNTSDIGCGVVEALFPLCRHQTTNVDWICLNGICLSEMDLDYLIGAAVEKSCHFRGLELNRCGLQDRTLGLILDSLRSQENTLEALRIAGNTARINPVAFDGQLSMFGFIRVLDLSNVSRTSGNEPLLTTESLLIWRLQDLRFSGTALNSATIDALATYLAHPQSDSLHELHLDNTYLTGSDIATLLHSMSRRSGEARDLHLDISQNQLGRDFEKVTQAISAGHGPSRLTMRAIEYKEEATFRKMLSALTRNKTIKALDISHTALPGDASEETCKSLERLLAENDTLVELDLSGEESRLATYKFGPGLNQALVGLKSNRSIRILRIEKQKLGFQGSSTLAEVLKENKTLQELHCGNNEIPLHGLTDLVNSLIDNTSLVYLPTMDDGRAAAFKAAEHTMKGLPDLETPASSPEPKLSVLPGTGAMKRGLANVKRTAARSAASAPSFPALPNLKSTPMHVRKSSQGTSPRNRANSQSPLATAFTVQDIQTTHRLLSEQWDRQCFRLGQYLDRNWCLLHNMPVNMEIEDEKFERPDSAGSISKMLEQVKYDTTPRAEKALYFDSPQDPIEVAGVTSNGNDVVLSALEQTPKKSADLSFRSFLLDSNGAGGDLTPERVRLDSKDGDSDVPRTPTQARFL